MAYSGQCLCGNVRYEIDTAPAMCGVCHCKNCQRQAGSAFSTIAGVGRATFHLLAGEPRLYADSATESGSTVERYFCGDGGSPLYSVVPGQPETLFLKTGTLDDTSFFKPGFQVWCDSKQDWVKLVDGIPSMEKQS